MEKGLRVGVNATIQSVSSDGMLIAVSNLQDEIEEHNLPMEIFNVIHDAVYILIREDFVEEADKIIVRHLSTWPTNIVSPFTGEVIVPPISMEADGEFGDSWDALTQIAESEVEEVKQILMDEYLDDDEEEEES